MRRVASKTEILQVASTDRLARPRRSRAMLKRCIVLYAQDALASHSDVKIASSCEDPQPSRESNCEALRSVSKAGASGLLVWRKSQTNKAYPSELEQVGQILGQHEWHEGREWCSSLEKDFNRAKCCLLSNQN